MFEQANKERNFLLLWQRKEILSSKERDREIAKLEKKKKFKII
jgi:hypothetical protein